MFSQLLAAGGLGGAADTFCFTPRACATGSSAFSTHDGTCVAHSKKKIKARGMTFLLAVGFETSGAETSACCELIKKNSVRLHTPGGATTRRTSGHGGSGTSR